MDDKIYCVIVYDNGDIDIIDDKSIDCLDYDIGEKLNTVMSWTYPPYIKCYKNNIPQMEKKLLKYRLDKSIRQRDKLNRNIELIKSELKKRGV